MSASASLEGPRPLSWCGRNEHSRVQLLDETCLSAKRASASSSGHRPSSQPAAGALARRRAGVARSGSRVAQKRSRTRLRASECSGATGQPLVIFWRQASGATAGGPRRLGAAHAALAVVSRRTAERAHPTRVECAQRVVTSVKARRSRGGPPAAAHGCRRTALSHPMHGWLANEVRRREAESMLSWRKDGQQAQGRLHVQRPTARERGEA